MVDEEQNNLTQGSGEVVPSEPVQDTGGLADGAEGGDMPGATDGQGVGLGSESDNIPTQIEAQPEAVLDPTEVVTNAPGEVAPVEDSKQSFIKNLLMKAGEKIQFNKRKKLEKVMGLAQKKTKISNKDVCEALRVSDVTAFRYLDILEKQGKIKQAGKTGRDVFYQLVP